MLNTLLIENPYTEHSSAVKRRMKDKLLSIIAADVEIGRIYKAQHKLLSAPAVVE